MNASPTTPYLKCENSVCCSVSSGTCCADPSPCTSGLGCNPLTDSCFVTCNDYDDSACADADSFCLSNACQPKLDDGATCVNRGECLSDHCDGVCCASSDCCTAPGDCPATYTIEPNCIVDPTECQGERFDPTCVDSQCGNTRIDDDSGCFGHQRDCANNFAPVVCTPESDQPLAICLTDCTTDGDCAAGHECAAPDCVVAPVLVPGDTTKVVARDGFEAQCIEWNGNSCTHAQIRPPIGEGPDTCAAFDGTSADWYDLAYCAAFVSNGDSAMWFCYFATGEIGNTNRTNTGVPIPDPYSFTHRFSASYSCIASPGGRTAWDSGVRGVHPDSDWVQVGYCDDSNRMAVECTGW